MRFFVYLTADKGEVQNVTSKHERFDTRLETVPDGSDDIELHVHAMSLGGEFAIWTCMRMERIFSSYQMTRG